jgi:hypothetical protein
MRAATRWLGIGSLWVLLTASAAWAQQAPAGAQSAAGEAAPAPLPRPDQLEPGVNTSATPPAPTPAAGAAPPSAAEPANSVTPAAGTPADGSKSTAAGAKGARGSRTPAAGAAGKPEPPAAARSGAGKAQDRIELDATQITGNRELPKVLYIVPWKRSDLGDLVGKPVNSLLDEVLAPVDRDVFKRENRYYDALKPDASRAPAGAAPPADAAGDKH